MALGLAYHNVIEKYIWVYALIFALFYVLVFIGWNCLAVGLGLWMAFWQRHPSMWSG